MRRYLRYNAEPHEFARISFNPELLDEEGFRTDQVGLIVDVSSIGGCCLVTNETENLKIGDICTVIAGNLPPIRAEVRWRTNIDAKIIKLGLQWLE